MCILHRYQHWYCSLFAICHFTKFDSPITYEHTCKSLQLRVHMLNLLYQKLLNLVHCVCTLEMVWFGLWIAPNEWENNNNNVSTVKICEPEHATMCKTDARVHYSHTEIRSLNVYIVSSGKQRILHSMDDLNGIRTANVNRVRRQLIENCARFFVIYKLKSM